MRLNEISKQDFKEILTNPFKYNINKTLSDNKGEIKLLGWNAANNPKFEDDHVMLEFNSGGRYLESSNRELINYFKDKFAKFGYSVHIMEYSPFVFTKTDHNLHIMVTQ